MRIIVPTNSISIEELLWPDKMKYFIDNRENAKWYRINIQNLGETDIYLENWLEATITWWYKIWVWNDVTFTYNNLWKVYLISELADNNNIRIITM
jgi:hypothetical protein